MSRPRPPFTALVLLTLAALLLISASLPSLRRRLAPTTTDVVQQAWARAQRIGIYDFYADVEQTTTPLPRLENVGLRPTVERLYIEGSTHLPARKMQLALTSSGEVSGAGERVELRVEDGEVSGRVGRGAWSPVEGQGTDLFAPGGDALAYLAGATGFEAVAQERRAGVRFTRYAFEVDGPAFARHMRDLLEAELARKGELPPSMSLGLASHYVEMEGSGEIWLDEARGLPLRLILDLHFPPGELDAVTARIESDFSGWGEESQAALLWGVRRADRQQALWRAVAGVPWQHGATGTLLLLSVVGVVAVMVRYRRGRRLYALFAWSSILSFVAGPPLQVRQSHAFYLGQRGAQVEHEAQQQHARELQQQQALTSERALGDFDPQVDPLAQAAARRAVQRSGGPAPAFRLGSGDGTDSDGDGLTDDDELLRGTDPADSDTDDDGLSDGIEVLELGTAPAHPDTDGDLVSDGAEVRGILDPSGATLYLDPFQNDSNRDGRSDLVECFALRDIDLSGSAPVVVTPEGSNCPDTDGDGTPDPWDADDDDDLVPDSVDLSPTRAVGGGRDGRAVRGFADNTFGFQIEQVEVDRIAYLDFQFRPTTPEHLWYSLSVLDWPSDDREGQITRVRNSTFGPSGADANGDLRLIPMVEIEIPYQDGHYGNLPVRPGAPAITPTSDPSEWLDGRLMSDYGITVRRADDTGTLLALVPATVVRDPASNSPVAFAARMVYRPTSAGFGDTHQARLLWFVQGITDRCVVPEGEEYESYCEQATNWTTNPPAILHIYDDDAWYLTGLSVREDHGFDLGIAFEDPTWSERNPLYEDALWYLVEQLDQTFLATTQALDIPEIARRWGEGLGSEVERWGIPADALQVERYLDQPDDRALAAIPITHTTQLLEAWFSPHSSPSSPLEPTLLFLREEQARAASLEDGVDTFQMANPVEGVIDDDMVTIQLDPTAVPLESTRAINWAPYRQNAAGEWESYPIGSYISAVEADYAALFTDLPGGAASPEGVASVYLSQLYYLTLFYGISSLVMLGDTPLETLALADEEVEDFEMVRDVAAASVGVARRLVSLVANQLADATANLELAEQALAALGNTWSGNVQGSPSITVGSTALRLTDTGVILVGVAAAALLLAGTLTDLGPGADHALDAIALLYASYNAVRATQKAATAISQAGGVIKAITSAANGASRVSVVAGVVGLVIIIGVQVGLFIYEIVASGTRFFSLAFNQALANLVAAVIVQVLIVALGFIPVVGPVIVFVIFLLDALIILVCRLQGAEAGPGYSAPEDYLCGGVSGLLTKALAYLIYSQNPIVNIQDPARLSLTNWGFTISDPAAGLVVGNSVTFSLDALTEIKVNLPTSPLGLSYLWQYANEFVRDSTFEYRFLSEKEELNVSVGERDDEWSQDGATFPDTRFTTRQSISTTPILLSAPGVNWRPGDLYVAEAHAIHVQECFCSRVPIPVPPFFVPVPVCYLRPERDTIHLDMSELLHLDIFPDTLSGFRALSAREGGYALAWDSKFPILNDGDGDGLRSAAAGGNDPNDSLADIDGDGVSDFYEVRHGGNPSLVDSDGDGLADPDELRHGTRLGLADSDNDGLTDREEVDGWPFVYAFDAQQQPIETLVTSDPLLPDTDGDGIGDLQERIYGFNPRLFSADEVLELRSEIGDEDALVKPGDTISYEATIENRLRDRYALGLFSVALPVAVQNADLAPQIFELGPADPNPVTPSEVTTITGQVTVDPAIAHSQVVSLTNEVGALIADLRGDADGRLLWLRHNEGVGEQHFRDDSLNAHDAECVNSSSCPAAGSGGYSGQALTFDGSNDYTLIEENLLGTKVNNFTLMAWVRPHRLSGRQRILTTQLSNSHNGFGLALDGTRVLFTLYGVVDHLTGVVLPATNRWYHIAVVRDASNRSLVYLNGRLVADLGVRTAHANADDGWMVGTVDTAPEAFDGEIDEVEIYDHALSAEEIGERFNAPILHLKLDESSSATSFVDASPLTNGTTCIVAQCPARGVTGRVGKALTFNERSWLTVSSNDGLDLSTGAGHFSFSTWIKAPTSSNGWRAAFGNDSGNSAYPTLWVNTQRPWIPEYGYQDQLKLRVRFGWGSGVCSVESDILLWNPSNWQHVAALFDGQQLRIFWNNEQVAASTPTNSNCSGRKPASNTRLWVGRADTKGSIYFSHVRVHDEGDGSGPAEHHLNYNGYRVWTHHNIDDNNNNGLTYTIDRTRSFDTDGAQYLLYCEKDNHNAYLCDTYGDSTLVSTDFYNFQDGDHSQYYNAGEDGGRGTLYWSISNSFFNGSVDDLRIYNRVLSEDELTRLFLLTERNVALHFDEPPGSRRAADASPNQTAATCSGAQCPDTGLQGRANQAARFDGLDDYMTLPPAEQFGLNNESFTVSVWVNGVEFGSGDRAILSTDSQVANQGLHLTVRSGKAYMGFWANDTSASTTLQPNRWYHLAYRYDINAQTQSIFVDGVRVAHAGGHGAFRGTGALRVGKHVNGGWFNGMIDELAIFNGALSDSEIAALVGDVPALNLHLDERLETTSWTDDTNFNIDASCNAAAGRCPGAGAAGRIRQGVVFDGIDDELTAPDHSALDLKSEYALSLWVRPEGLKGARQALLVKAQDGSSYINYGLYLAPNSTRLIFNAHVLPFGFNCSGLALAEFTSTRALRLGEWNHVVATFTTNNDEGMRLYINGTLDTTLPWGTGYQNGGICTNDAPVRLGNGPGGELPFAGQLDEVAIYGRLLTREDVETLFHFQSAWYDLKSPHSLTVDAEPPTVSLAFDPTLHLPPGPTLLAVQADDLTTGVALVEVRLDGGVWQPATQDSAMWIFTFDPATTGAVTVEARATDRVGHSSTSSATVTVDGTPPTVTLDGVSEGQLFPARAAGPDNPWTLPLGGTVADSGGSGVAAVLVELLPATGTAPGGGIQAATVSGTQWSLDYRFPASPDDRYMVRLVARDRVGNELVTTLLTLGVDTFGPEAEIYPTEPISTVLAGVDPLPMLLGNARAMPEGVGAGVERVSLSLRHARVANALDGRALDLPFEEAPGATAFRDNSPEGWVVSCNLFSCPESTAGYAGRGLLFDGDGDYLHSPDFPIEGEIGMAAWLRADAIDGTRTIIAHGLAPDTNSEMFLRLHDGHYEVGASDGTARIARTPIPVGDEGQWVHLAGTWDGSGWRLYRNGVLVAEQPGMPGALGGGVDWSIAAAHTSDNEPRDLFAGALDEVLLYERALTADEVAYLAQPDRWLTATLDQPGAPTTEWQLPVPAGLEGPHQVDVRSVNLLGHARLHPNLWEGEVDTVAPRLTFTVTPAGDESIVRCVAEDYNLTEEGYSCPLPDGQWQRGYVEEPWFTDIFTDSAKLARLDSEPLVISGTHTALTACDLMGNCATIDAASTRATDPTAAPPRSLAARRAALAGSAPPALSLSTSAITADTFSPGGFITLAGRVTDTLRLVEMAAQVDGDGWQPLRPPAGSGAWSGRIWVGQVEAPAGGDRLVTVRATNEAGLTVEASRLLPADAVPPAPADLSLSYEGAAGETPIRAGAVISDVARPALTLAWEGGDSSDVTRTLAGWTESEEPQLDHLVVIDPGDPRMIQQVAGEAQRLYAHLVREDGAGNRRVQSVGPIYTDYVATPSYRDDEAPLDYHGWQQAACTMVGVDKRALRQIGAAGAARAQRFYTTWDEESLRLAWAGADWNHEGDLWIYLDTLPGGSIRLYDPYPATADRMIAWLPVHDLSQPGGEGHVGADFLIHVEDETQAQLRRWDQGSETWVVSDVPWSYEMVYRDGTLSTSLDLPLDTLGISDAASSPLTLLAFASEEEALELWATMPDGNPVNSARVLPGDATKGPYQFMLTHKVGWPSLGPGICPSGQGPEESTGRSRSGEPLTAPGVDVQLAVDAEPAGIAYSLLNDNLYFAMDRMFTSMMDWDAGRAELCETNAGTPFCEQRGDSGRLASAGGMDFNPKYLLGAFRGLHHQHVRDGQPISYRIHVRNRGSAPATGVVTEIKTWGQVRLPSGELHQAGGGHEYYTLRLEVGDLAPGESRIVRVEGVIDTTFDIANNLNWATLDAVMYDDSGDKRHNVLDWLFFDHQIDSSAPAHVAVNSPRRVLGPDTLLQGTVLDASAVPTIEFEAYHEASRVSGRWRCTDNTPEDGQWACPWQGGELRDGEEWSVRARATDAYGQQSPWGSAVTLMADRSPPASRLGLATHAALSDGVIGADETLFTGLLSDNRQVAGAELCLATDGEPVCSPIQLALDQESNVVGTVQVEDVPAGGIALDGGTACGSDGEIVRRFTVERAFNVRDLQVGMNLTHAYRADVSAWLRSPAGTEVQLLAGGSYADNYDLLLDDAAPAFFATDDGGDRRDHNTAAPYYDQTRRPAGWLRDFDGEPAQGEWELHLCDSTPEVDDGRYHHTLLRFTTDLLPDGSSALWSWQLPITPGSDGAAQQLALHAWDNAGNHATRPLTQTVRVDVVAPVLTIDSISEQPVAGYEPLALRGRVTDGDQVQIVRLSIVTPNGERITRRVELDGTTWAHDELLALPGHYQLTVEAEDRAGNVASLGPRTVVAGEPATLHFPLVGHHFFQEAARPEAPDLEVLGNTALLEDVATIWIVNSGTLSVTTPFRVDLYFDPSPEPAGAGELWDELSALGGYWLVTEAALPLLPGAILTLTLDGPYYQAGGSEYPDTLDSHTLGMVQVDSLDDVSEVHEQQEARYNNLHWISLVDEAEGEGE